MPNLALIDWKTSAYRSLEEQLQLAAYWGCPFLLQDGQLVPREEGITQAMIVHVWEQGCKVETRMTEADLRTAYEKFREVVDLFTWMVSKGQVRIPENEAYCVNGRYYPSVTYLLQHIIAKPGLLNWSYEGGVVAGLQADALGCTPEAIAQAIAAKTRLEDKSLKRTDPAANAWFDLTAKLHEAGLSTTAKRDGRAGQGTSVHKNLLWYLQGRPVSMAEAPDWLRQSLVHASAWMQRVKLAPVYLEQKLVNEELGYAGTADVVGWIEEHVT